MRRPRAHLFALPLLLTVIAGAFPAGAPARAETVRLHGASIFEATVIRPFGPQVERDTGIRLHVVPNRSDLGLMAVARGEVDLAMITGPLPEQAEALAKATPGLPYAQLVAHAITPVRAAFAVNSSNTVKRLTLDQIARMLVGEITNWREVGGSDLPVRIVAVKPGGGVLACVETTLLGRFTISAPDAIRVPAGKLVIKVVAQEEGALGISQTIHLRGEVGVRELATDETIEPMLSLVSLGPPTPAAAKLIAALQAKFRTAR